VDRSRRRHVSPHWLKYYRIVRILKKADRLSLEAFSAATFSALSWRRMASISASRSAAGVCRCAGRVGMIVTNEAIMRASSDAGHRALGFSCMIVGFAHAPHVFDHALAQWTNPGAEKSIITDEQRPGSCLR
jgi:hypothetical protein